MRPFQKSPGHWNSGVVIWYNRSAATKRKNTERSQRPSHFDVGSETTQKMIRKSNFKLPWIDNVYKGLRLESFAAWRTSYGNGDEILTAMRRSNTESRMLMDWLSLLIYLAILLYIAITNWYLFILYLIIGWVGKTACVFTVWHCGCDLWIRFENSTHGWFSPQEHQTSFVIRFLPNFGRRWWEISSPFLFHWQSFYDAFG